MTRRRCYRCALTAILFLVLPKVGAAADKADNQPTVAKSHASLKAYPNAVVSLKDPKSGALYYVESNGRRLVAFDKNDAIAWSIDVLDAVKDGPLVGQPVIRHLKLDHGQLTVTIAKHAHCEVDTNNGKLKYLGAD